MDGPSSKRFRLWLSVEIWQFNVDEERKRGRPKGSRNCRAPPLQKLQHPRRRNSKTPVNLRSASLRPSRRCANEVENESSTSVSDSSRSVVRPRKYYLVDSSIENFCYIKLPKTRDILQRILYLSAGPSVKPAIKQTVAELRDVWKHHFGVGPVWRFWKRERNCEDSNDNRQDRMSSPYFIRSVTGTREKVQ